MEAAWEQHEDNLQDKEQGIEETPHERPLVPVVSADDHHAYSSARSIGKRVREWCV
jgi:hypothetical protein